MQSERYELFYAAMRELVRADDLMAEYGSIPRKYGPEILYEREVHTVRHIGKYPGVTVTGLSEVFHYTTSACSQTVKKLRERGLVYRQQNARNNKEYHLFLTEKGMEVYDAHERFDKECYDCIFEGLAEFTSEDFENYIALQKALNREIARDVRERVL